MVNGHGEEATWEAISLSIDWNLVLRVLPGRSSLLPPAARENAARPVKPPPSASTAPGAGILAGPDACTSTSDQCSGVPASWEDDAEANAFLASPSRDDASLAPGGPITQKRPSGFKIENKKHPCAQSRGACTKAVPLSHAAELTGSSRTRGYHINLEDNMRLYMRFMSGIVHCALCFRHVCFAIRGLVARACEPLPATHTPHLHVQ
jgi:hypothetical protein